MVHTQTLQRLWLAVLCVTLSSCLAIEGQVCEERYKEKTICQSGEVCVPLAHDRGERCVSVVSPPCGDGAHAADEACDWSDLDSDSYANCTDECEIDTCGDSRVDPGEDCDDGNRDSEDGCNSRCMHETCGNGDVDGYEECDDGNNDNNDECSNTCALLDLCGNGRIDEGEECDERGIDTCTRSCKRPTCSDGERNGVETGIDCGGGCAAVCGGSDPE